MRVIPGNRLTNNLPILKKLKHSLMIDRTDNFPNFLTFHGFLTHQQHIITAAIVIENIKSMRVGEPCFVHFQLCALLVHKSNKLMNIKLHTLLILT